MTDVEVAGAARPTRRLTLVAIALWSALAFGLPLSALTLNGLRIAGFPLGFWVAAQGVLIAFVILAWVFERRAGGVHTPEGTAPAIQFAGETITSAGYIGFAGLIAGLGFDGLAFPLGITAGLALIAIVIAPRFALYPAETVAGFFTARFAGVWSRRVAVAIACGASVLILAADLRGAALAVQGLVTTGYVTALAAVAAMVGLVWLARPLMSRLAPRGSAYWILFFAFLATLVCLALQQGRMPLPQLVYGAAIEDVTLAEQKLLAAKLADIKALKPLASPFLHLSMLNFAGIVLGLALGIAALPHLLGRHLTHAAVPAGDAPRRAARALTLVGLFMLGVAAFAVLARLAIAGLLATGISTATLPDSIVQASGLGWVEVCGATSFSAADLAAACAKLSGHKGILRLQDLGFSEDGFLFAASRIAGIPVVAWWALVGGGLLAAVVSGHALISGLVAAAGEGRRHPEMANGGGLELKAVLLFVAVMLAAMWVALTDTSGIPVLVSEGLTLVAAGLFPAFALGLYWRRFNASGAVAAMLAGFALAALYIAGVRWFPVLMFDLTGSLSNAAGGAVRKYSDLKAALAAAPNETARESARMALVQHAQTLVNWWGLKSGAMALLAVPAGVIAGALVTFATARGQRSTP